MARLPSKYAIMFDASNFSIQIPLPFFFISPMGNVGNGEKNNNITTEFNQISRQIIDFVRRYQSFLVENVE